jgi:hypothetical protein
MGGDGMIDENDLEDAALASKEPQQRFRFIEQLAAKRLTSMRHNDDTMIYDDFDYMCAVLSAAKAFEIDELTPWQLPSRSEAGWSTTCRDFRAAATQVSMRILFEYASRPDRDPYSVALDPATKQKLRFFIEQLRSVVDAEPIADWKKQGLYDAIANLEAEIEKARTPFGALFDVVGKAFEGDIKVAEALQQIVVIFKDAKAVEAQATLIGGTLGKAIRRSEAKQLPPPSTPRLGAVRKSNSDDIPF